MIVTPTGETYPRRYCLGLIEASKFGTRRRWPWRGIRGVIASASLKLQERIDSCRRGSRYPRRYCLGLIEAVRRILSFPGFCWYPRRYCLGLIEASFRHDLSPCPRQSIRGVIASASLKPGIKGGSTVFFVGVSEALLPRPH